MQSRSPRFLGVLIFGVLALALGAGLSFSNAHIVRAQSMSPGQMGAASGSCADEDSWCNYCMAHTSADICTQDPPVMVAASSGDSATGSGPSDMTSEPASSMMSMTTAGSAYPSWLSGLLNPTPGVTWQYCPSSVTGVMWMATSSQGGNLIC